MRDATVVLVGDDPSVRDSLSLLLSLKGLHTRIYASAERLLETYDPGWRGCVLTDLKMPGMSGIELQQALAARGARLPVVVLTAHGDVATTRLALKAGAFDFLEKPVDDAVLLDVLLNAIERDRARHAAEAERSVVEDRVARLTPREREVLLLISRGLQNREIGAELGISPRTVEVYKARMMEKLQCRSVADAVRISLEVTQG